MPTYLKAPSSSNLDLENSDEHSSGSESKYSPNPSSSPNPKYKIINHYLNRVADKRLPLSSKRFPTKNFSKELQTLPEPNDNPLIEIKLTSTEPSPPAKGIKKSLLNSLEKYSKFLLII